jgi:multidrug efflux pump subunit AcrB
VSIDDVFSTLGTYVGSSYVDQFNKFSRVFPVYVQADSKFCLRPEDIELLGVHNKQGSIIPLGTMVKITPTVGPSLLSLCALRAYLTCRGGKGIAVVTTTPSHRRHVPDARSNPR